MPKQKRPDITLIYKYFTCAIREIKDNHQLYCLLQMKPKTEFVTYLLQNTNKTIEERAALARVPVEFVVNAKPE